MPGGCKRVARSSSRPRATPGSGWRWPPPCSGYRVIAVMPDKMSDEKIPAARLRRRDVITPTAVAPDSPESYNGVADRLAREIPDLPPNQFVNLANPEIHYRTTGPEIWAQTGGPDHRLVVGVGTGGTISGVGRYLKEQNPEVRVIGADPEGSVLSGGAGAPEPVEGIGEDFVPKTLDGRWSTVVTRQRRRVVPDTPPAGRPRGDPRRRLERDRGGRGLAVARGSDPTSWSRRSSPTAAGRTSRRSSATPGCESTDTSATSRAADGRRACSPRGQAGRRSSPCRGHDQVARVLQLMREHGVSQVPVVSAEDQRAFVGTVFRARAADGLRRPSRDPRRAGHRSARGRHCPRALPPTTRPTSAVRMLREDARCADRGGTTGRRSGVLTAVDLVEALNR